MESARGRVVFRLLSLVGLVLIILVAAWELIGSAEMVGVPLHHWLPNWDRLANWLLNHYPARQAEAVFWVLLGAGMLLRSRGSGWRLVTSALFFMMGFLLWPVRSRPDWMTDVSNVIRNVGPFWIAFLAFTLGSSSQTILSEPTRWPKWIAFALLLLWTLVFFPPLNGLRQLLPTALLQQWLSLASSGVLVVFGWIAWRRTRAHGPTLGLFFVWVSCMFIFLLWLSVRPVHSAPGMLLQYLSAPALLVLPPLGPIVAYMLVFGPLLSGHSSGAAWRAGAA